MILTNSAYGTYHIICLIASISLIILGIIFLKKIKITTAINICLLLGVISETLKVFSYIIANEGTLGGYLPKTDLPFQLCSLQILLFIFLKFNKNDNIKHSVMCFMIPTCLVGGLAAFFIPTNSSLNMPVVTVQYYMYHAMIVWFAIYLLFVYKIELTIKDYLNTLIMLFALAFIEIYLNSWVQTENAQVNFMYVVRPPANNLPFLNTDHGWLVYFIHYAFTAVFVVTMFYIKPIINFFKNMVNKKQIDN